MVIKQICVANQIRLDKLKSAYEVGNAVKIKLNCINLTILNNIKITIDTKPNPSFTEANNSTSAYKVNNFLNPKITRLLLCKFKLSDRQQDVFYGIFPSADMKVNLNVVINQHVGDKAKQSIQH